MDFLKLMTEARTCRRFDASRELEPDFLQWLVECVRVASSASNAQVLRYITVRKPENRVKMREALLWAGMLKEWDGPVPSECPTGYMIFLAPSENGKLGPNTLIDLGIMGESMQLAASTRGVAACMFRAYKPKEIAQIVDIPEGYEVAMNMAFGYPVEERRLVPVGPDGSIKYYRDENGVHCVPKRTVSELLVGEY